MRVRSLERLFGPIASARVECSPYASSHPLEVVAIRLAGGGARRVVLKHAHVLLPAARHAKPSFAHASGRELHVYRNVLPGVSEAPVLLGVLDGALVLEHVEGVPLVEVGDLACWECAARTAARLHRRLAGHPATALPRLDRSYFARWLERAQAFHGEALGDLAGPAGAAAERLAELPPTIVHGELYAPNVLIRPDGRACLLDWETAAVGPGLFDLVALTSGALPDGGRDRIVAAYAGELGLDPGELAGDIECCRLLIAIQWLGWSDRWTPPPAGAHDWRDEAVRAAEALA